jgi:hypothetical protein
MAEFHDKASLECGLCFEPYSHYSRPCVILCARGHSSCGPCGKRVRHCPTCRDPLLVPGGIPNRALMDIIMNKRLDATYSAENSDSGGLEVFSTRCHRGHQMTHFTNGEFNSDVSLSCNSCLSENIQLREEYYKCSGCGTVLCLRCFSNSSAAFIGHPPTAPCSHRNELKKRECIDALYKACNICYQQLQGTYVYCSGCDSMNICSLCFKANCINGHSLVQPVGASSDETCVLCHNRSTALNALIYLRCYPCKYSICSGCAFG